MLKTILAFAQYAIGQAKAYTDAKFSAVKSGLTYKGTVDYVGQLPGDHAEGDCYTVLYRGSSGTDEDGTEYVWTSSGWVAMGPSIAGKVDKVSGTNGNIVVFGTNGQIADSGKKPSDFDVSATVENMTLKI